MLCSKVEKNNSLKIKKKKQLSDKSIDNLLKIGINISLSATPLMTAHAKCKRFQPTTPGSDLDLEEADHSLNSK